MSDDPYQLLHTPPGPEDFIRLRDSCGLSAYPAAAVEAGLAGTWFGVRILHDSRVIGMGRIIGDGACVFQVTDIAVDPAHQGKGLGRRILAALTEHLETHAPAGAYVSLIADLPADRLYAEFGFAPVAPRSIGMAKRTGG